MMNFMESKSLLVQFLGDNPMIKIVDFLLDNKGMEFRKKDIIRRARISKATLFNCWQRLEKQEITKVTRRFGKTKLYTLNFENKIVKKLLELESVLIQTALEKNEQSVEIYA